MEENEKQQSETEAPEAAKDEALSLDDALEKAIADGAALDKEEEERDTKGADASDEGDVKETEAAPERPAEPELPAPAEFNAAEKEAWAKGDRKGILAGLERLHKSRTQEFFKKEHEFKAKEEAWTKREKEAELHRKVVEAIEKNPALTLAQIAKLKNLKLADLENPQPKQSLDPDTDKRIAALESEIVAERQTKVQAAMAETVRGLMAETNESGGLKYPALSDSSEESLKLCSMIGSTVANAEFQRLVKARIPDAGLKDFIKEAYRFHGGRVDEPKPIQSPQAKTEHVSKAKRAAVSVPGRVSRPTGTSNRKFKDTASALEAALEDLEIG